MRRCHRSKLHNLRTTTSQKCAVAEAGSYLRLVDSCITQLKVQGPSGTCNESQEGLPACDAAIGPSCAGGWAMTRLPTRYSAREKERARVCVYVCE